MTDTCLVKLDLFEGPLDLLLHLIKKNEVNIYDIPIAIISKQYLEYIDLMKVLNFEVAGSYLVIAAELGKIKSRMLLPKSEYEDEEEEEDPRDELVQRLIEYQRYKEAVKGLIDNEILGRDVFLSGNRNGNEKTQELELIKPDLWSLIGAFHSIIERRKADLNADISFEAESISLEDKMAQLKDYMVQKRIVHFFDMFENHYTKFEFIITFLALLELVKNRVLKVLQNEPYNYIEIIYLGEDQLG